MPFYLSSDQSYMYTTIAKVATSDGASIFRMTNAYHTSLPHDTVPAWDVTLTVGANGTISNSLGTDFTSGPVAVQVGDDITLTVEGDAGYLTTSILLDSVEQL